MAASPRPVAHHVVRFASRDVELIPALADFVADGIRLGERTALLITDARWAALEQHLLSAHVRIGAALKHGEVVVISADEVYREIRSAGGVDAPRFRSIVGSIIASLTPPVRAYGELVSLLAADGHVDAVLTIEELGAAMSRDAGVNVLCAYHPDHLTDSDLHRVASAHDVAVADGTSPRGLRPIVLLAGDDAADDIDLHVEHLRANGYQSVSARDGLQAVALARMSQPSVVVLDVRLPRMSGIEAVQILRKEPAFSRVPIVALALPREAANAALRQQGFDEVLTKPCRPADLAAAVARLLDGV